MPSGNLSSEAFEIKHHHFRQLSICFVITILPSWKSGKTQKPMAWMRNTRNAVAWDPGTLGAWDGDLPKYTYICQQISSHVICGAWGVQRALHNVHIPRYMLWSFQVIAYSCEEL